MVGPVAVEFRPQALVEFADLLRYYSTIGGRTLAERVRDDIEQVLVRLSDDPFSAQAFEGHPTLRRAVSRHVPPAVLGTWLADGRVGCAVARDRRTGDPR